MVDNLAGFERKDRSYRLGQQGLIHHGRALAIYKNTGRLGYANGIGKLSANFAATIFLAI